jgi:type VI secretion system ImpJ/VasE family protein
MPGPVHWHEGLFLQPHHLQTMQHFVLDRINAERRLAYTFPYGVTDMKISADALENMLVRFDRLRAVMPSGIEVNFPENADLPSLDIKAAFEASSQPFTVSLAIPLWYDSRANAIDAAVNGAAAASGGSGGGNGDWRVKRIYKVAEVQRTDENTGENAQPMMVRRLNARLILADDDHTDLEVLPLLRIAHATGQDVGTARQEPAYIPPCLTVGGSATLRERLRDLTNQVQASRTTLVQQITAGGFTIDAMRGVQFEQAMRLRTLNRYAARLGSMVNVANLIRPFEFYLDLRELLGELAAGQPARDKEFFVPEYDHDNLQSSFDDLINKIRSLLGGTVQERYLKIDFVQEGGVLVLQKPLEPEHLEKPTDYFLGIKTRDDHAALAKLVEDGDKFKLMAKSMIQQRIWGIKLQEERHPPLTLPAKGDLFYYRLMRGESARMWDRIKDEKTMAARWPDMQTSDFQLALYMPIP